MLIRTAVGSYEVLAMPRKRPLQEVNANIPRAPLAKKSKAPVQETAKTSVSIEPSTV